MIDLDIPMPEPEIPVDPVKAKVEALAAAPIGASVLFDKTETTRANIFVRSGRAEYPQWVVWTDEGDDGAVRYWKKTTRPQET